MQPVANNPSEVVRHLGAVDCDYEQQDNQGQVLSLKVTSLYF